MSLSQKSTQGSPLSDNNGGRAPWSALDFATLKAISATDPNRTHGNDCMVDTDNSSWWFNKNSALTGDDMLVVAPTAGSGRWLRKTGGVALWVPISFATTNDQHILTIPTGCAFKLERALWKVTTAWTGGTNAAIGISSSLYTTDGDILGGATGELLAGLTAGIRSGTIGVKMDTVSEIHAQVYVAGDYFKFDRVADAFTAGAGYVILCGYLAQHLGA